MVGREPSTGSAAWTDFSSTGMSEVCQSWQWIRSGAWVRLSSSKTAWQKSAKRSALSGVAAPFGGIDSVPVEEGRVVQPGNSGRRRGSGGCWMAATCERGPSRTSTLRSQHRGAWGLAVARHRYADLVAASDQRFRQRAHHVGQTADLGKRHALGKQRRGCSSGPSVWLPIEHCVWAHDWAAARTARTAPCSPGPSMAAMVSAISRAGTSWNLLVRPAG